MRAAMSAANADPVKATAVVRASKSFFIFNSPEKSWPPQKDRGLRFPKTIGINIDGSVRNAVAAQAQSSENGCRGAPSPVPQSVYPASDVEQVFAGEFGLVRDEGKAGFRFCSHQALDRIGRALAVVGEQHALEQSVPLRLIARIDPLGAMSELIERRHREVEMPFVDQPRHLAVKKGDQK